MAASIAAIAAVIDAANPWLLRSTTADAPAMEAAVPVDRTPSPGSAEGVGSSAVSGPPVQPSPDRSTERSEATATEPKSGTICDAGVFELADGASCSVDAARAAIRVQFVERFGKARPSLTVVPHHGEVVRRGFVGPGEIQFEADGEPWRLNVVSIQASERTVQISVGPL
ncbi:MAG: hypothetical protein AAGN46_18710 [Acidobacteriota bacterium]